MEARRQPAAASLPDTVDARHHPRYRIAVPIKINSRTCGLLKGYTVDISESGISAMLRIEVPVGEVVELDFILPFGQVTIYSIVRQRCAFRYGFQFMESNFVQSIIRPTCRELAMEQSLFGSPQK